MTPSRTRARRPTETGRLVADLADALQVAVVLSRRLRGVLGETTLSTDAARLDDAVQSAARALHELGNHAADALAARMTGRV